MGSDVRDSSSAALAPRRRRTASAAPHQALRLRHHGSAAAAHLLPHIFRSAAVPGSAVPGSTALPPWFRDSASAALTPWLHLTAEKGRGRMRAQAAPLVAPWVLRLCGPATSRPRLYDPNTAVAAPRLWLCSPGSAVPPPVAPRLCDSAAPPPWLHRPLHQLRGTGSVAPAPWRWLNFFQEEKTPW